jgi:acetyl esterase/lipase
MDRREAMGLGMVAALSTQALADAVLPGDGALPGDPTETVALWPGIPPGGEGMALPLNRVTERAAAGAPQDRFTDRIGAPRMDVFRPDRPDGSAVIIAPGGAYVREVLDGEGFETARRLNGAGVTAFVLRYRLPNEGWARRSDVPLQDAQRAMRLVRANASRYGVDPARLGFMGFSAGGHIAVSIATRFAAPVYAPLDSADGIDAKPAFVVAMYPVVTMGEGAHAGSRDNLLGPSPTPAEIAAYSCEKNVTADTPPCFVCLAADDTTVPPLSNGLAFFAALRAANVSSELHMFERGGHGFGIAKAAGKPVVAWPDLMIAWCRSHGFFKA